jgi:hypothetical protein
MKHFLSISLLLVFFTTSALQNIIEHAEFASIFNYITEDDYHKNTVVILDIDNTIAIQGHPFRMLGGDIWVNYEIAKLIEQGIEPKKAVAQVLPFYYELTHFVDLKPVEPSIPWIIKQLQDAGITVIACTIRSIEISDRTIEQLRAIDIDFAHSAFGYNELLGHGSSFRYKDGIIFCCGGDKGITLKHVLAHFEHTPTKVIVIDDKEKYLHQIKCILHPDIEFIGIRYSHLDEKVANFDSALAEQEKQAYLSGSRDTLEKLA